METLSFLCNGAEADVPLEKNPLRKKRNQWPRQILAYPAVVAWLALVSRLVLARPPSAATLAAGASASGVPADGSVAAWGWNLHGQTTVPGLWPGAESSPWPRGLPQPGPEG